ncbi:MAG: ABC transporter permease subunit [Candidatus Cloacimonetes bacterium]|nr:ABC transporter permease subunit [Candidatus Cloacimonadota bacterium]
MWLLKVIIVIGIFLLFYSLLIQSLNIDFKDALVFNFSIKLLLMDVTISVIRVTVISLLSWVAAIISAKLISMKRIFRISVLPVFNFMRHISPFAWIPFSIIWFGLGELSIQVVMFIALYFPVTILCLEAFGGIEREYLDEAAVLGANLKQVFFFIELPILKKQLIDFYRLTWGIGWITLVAAEMLGVKSGMGFRLLDFRYLLQYQSMAFYIIVMGIIGILADKLINYLYEEINDL